MIVRKPNMSYGERWTSHAIDDRCIFKYRFLLFWGPTDQCHQESRLNWRAMTLQTLWHCSLVCCA